MFQRLLIASILRRLFRGSRHQDVRRTRSPYGTWRTPARQPPRGGFGMWGPLPSYSRTTRGGSRVRVTGCCLPIPLMLTSTMAAGAAVATRRAVRSRV